ncbi:hypothetical protein PtA15_5A792 [Puccinia triticina]|uniref:Uncharacterized protein n=1 Tax=Puccinia triticina TaxID=208348 RepID=A0ABY7CJZ1_9BASI|nr:uncharacterized protein PtA15_5A792 [Puccinia triticina]WAQ85218.1 hypothetical protein PtA15_5A792 [Puccinia triticina]
MNTRVAPPQQNHEPTNPCITPFKRSAEHFELQTNREPKPGNEPSKSRRLDFMKNRIRTNLEAYRFLAEKSESAYHYFTLGNLSVAATHYKNFLARCSWWKTSVKEGGQLVIIRSIFNLARCYLAMGQFREAEITLQELWDLKKGGSISSTDSMFTELAVLYSEVKKNSTGDDELIDDGPEVLGLERRMRSAQRRSQSLNVTGHHNEAVDIIYRALQSLPTGPYKLDKSLRDLLVDLHLTLAEGYEKLGRHAEASLTLNNPSIEI